MRSIVTKSYVRFTACTSTTDFVSVPWHSPVRSFAARAIAGASNRTVRILYVEWIRYGIHSISNPRPASRCHGGRFTRGFAAEASCAPAPRRGIISQMRSICYLFPRTTFVHPTSVRFAAPTQSCHIRFRTVQTVLPYSAARLTPASSEEIANFFHLQRDVR